MRYMHTNAMKILIDCQWETRNSALKVIEKNLLMHSVLKLAYLTIKIVWPFLFFWTMKKR